MPNIADLISQYTDIIGRCTVHPSNKEQESQGNFDSNNALLYTGELALLMAKAGIYSFNYQTMHNLAFNRCEGRSGVFSRHPLPYCTLPDMTPISMDEYRGVCMTCTVSSQMKGLMGDIIRYGNHNNWVFNDQPDQIGKGLPLISLLKTPIRTFQELRKYYARAKEIGMNNGGMRKAALEFKYLNPMFFWTQPNNRAFYKLCANNPATLWEKWYFLLSEIAGAFSSDDGQNSSRFMGGFMHLALNNVKHDSWLVKVSRSVYHYSCRYHHGKNYMYNMSCKYFRDQQHPITVLSYGVEVL